MSKALQKNFAHQYRLSSTAVGSNAPSNVGVITTEMSSLSMDGRLEAYANLSPSARSEKEKAVPRQPCGTMGSFELYEGMYSPIYLAIPIMFSKSSPVPL
jgi:hypothetical protein